MRHPAHAGGQAGAKAKLYNPRHPERTLLYQTISEHFATWHELASAGQFDGQGDHHTPKPYIRQAFRKYLECGIFAHGFARAWCDDCGHDYFVAYSCKGRGVCPSCNTRRMVETAAHLCDHVFPRLPVRQWVLSVPKRLRYFMQRDGEALNMVLRIFLRVIAQTLQTHSPGAAQVDRAALHIGAVAFLHRFGSSLNGHVHFHVCAVDGVFEEVVGQGQGDVDADVQSPPPGIVFHPASTIDATAVTQVQSDLRRRILRAFVGRGLIEKADAKEMLCYQHSGFSVDADVCIEAHDRAALERLLRYCARPPFACERLRKEGAELVYRCAKQHSEPGSNKRGAKVDELHLTPLELIDRIAALVPPPRTHRHHYFGVLAPNSALRAVFVDHVTIHRFRRRKRAVNSSWRLDEMYIKVSVQWKYLYRAVDNFGDTVDFLLIAKRDLAAARRFLKRAIDLHDVPEKITIDKSGANTAAIESVKTDACVDILMRQNKYLNNIVEQDHRTIKRITRPMLGFKSFWSARITIAGTETMHMIKKGQMSCPAGQPASAANQFYSLAA